MGMTLDEAIKHAREVARVNILRTKHPAVHRNDEDEIAACLLCAEEHKQIAEWLEELKEFKQLYLGSDTYGIAKSNYDLGCEVGYNKAIDDFSTTLIERLTDAIHSEDVGSARNLINEISEQLKDGEENE